ncbi:MAG: hypothetical protein ACRESZ_06685 [Methylococcales bacterium]
MNFSFITPRRFVWLALFILSVPNQLSCAKQPLPESAEKEALKSRVQPLWDAMIANDFDKVYEFTTPSYRRTYSKAHFFAQYGSQITRESITVLDIVFQNPERSTAKVTLNLSFSTQGFSASDVFRNTVYVEETWIKDEDQWWRVEKR